MGAIFHKSGCGATLSAPPFGIWCALANSIATNALDPRPTLLAPSLELDVELTRGPLAFQCLRAGDRLRNRPNVLGRRVAVKRHVRLHASADS